MQSGETVELWKLSPDDRARLLKDLHEMDARVHAFIKSVCGDRYSFREGHPSGSLDTGRYGHNRWIDVRYGGSGHIWGVATVLALGEPRVAIFVRNGACYHTATVTADLFPCMEILAWAPQEDTYGRLPVGDVRGLWECNETSYSETWDGTRTASIMGTLHRYTPQEPPR